MTMLSIRGAAAVAAALAATATAAAPVAAQAPRPTLQTDEACYSPGDVMNVNGTGYTPNGQVNLSFAGRGLAFFEATADQAGLLGTDLNVTDDDVENFLGNDETSRTINVTAHDVSRGMSEESVAVTRTVFSRFTVLWNQTDDAFEPGRRLALRAVGFTGMAGRPLYLHYVRNGRRLATVRLGLLTGACGTLRKTLPRAFPRSIVRPGRWSLVFGTSRTQATPRNGMWLRIDVRIRR